MLSSNPKVSVIIPTLFREKYCVLCVEDLMVQDYENFEIVIIEQGARHAVIADLEKRFPKKVVYYFIGEKVSMTKARNFGASHATGEVISFLDDDFRVPEDFLSKAVKLFLADPKLAVLSPKIIQPHEAVKTNQDGGVGQVTSSGKVLGNFSAEAASKINVAHRHSFFAKSAFDEVGGFDLLFRGNGTRSESDLSLRITRKGHTLLFDPAVECIHIKAPYDTANDPADRVNSYFDFFYNDFLFFLKNFQKRHMALFFLRNLRAIFRAVLYYGKGRPRAFVLPFQAYWASYKAYKAEQKTQ